MSQASVALRLDKLGGLSHTDHVQDLSASESDTSKIKAYLAKHVVSLKHCPKIVFFAYILGFVTATALLVNIFLVTTVESGAVLGFLVACPFLLIVLGGVGGHFENKWKKGLRAAQKKVLLLTDNRCALEVGYEERCGKDAKRPLHFCNSRQAFLLLFDLAHYKEPIRAGERYQSGDGRAKCVVSPFARTSVQRHNLPSGKKKGAKKTAREPSSPKDAFAEAEAGALTLDPKARAQPVQASSKTIEMQPEPEEPREQSREQRSGNPYKVDAPGGKEGALGRHFSEADIQDENIWRGDQLGN